MLTNVGDRPLTVNDHTASEGWRVPEHSCQQVPPGGTCVMTVEWLGGTNPGQVFLEHDGAGGRTAVQVEVIR